jgi:hypothetical protein
MSIRTPSDLRRLAVALLLAFAAVGDARADDDPMAPYRERFRTGMDRYKAGDYAGALYSWEPIYRDVGPEKGYRVAFDLARAYEKFGDATRAAERYEGFISQVDARRGRGEALEALVLKEETEARARLADIVAARGRIHVEATPPTSARVDALDPRLTPFTAYVPPGTHVVTFAPGMHDEVKQETAVAAGQIVTVVAPVPTASVATPVPAPPAPTAPATTPTPAPPPPAPTLARVEHRVEHPFPAGVLVASSVVTLGAVVFTTVEYARASSARSDFNGAAGDPTHQAGIRDTYDGERTGAYAGLGASIGLGVITGALSTWYLAGAREHDVPVAPVVVPTEGGASAGVVGRF